ncbi:DoxX family protein [Paenimyroides aestuarii]|uniref:DoxX family membrane protein n=1 Tax=Paenimyroides aestuarii TaxID=2968490 RepID=A0ABY5NUN3_9FLAO|nr:DoxX family membrane protein [Paenimyroides aestuarii]UUV22245.1 DoxX family membrane protein [Paenimyroides aestuarii]
MNKSLQVSSLSVLILRLCLSGIFVSAGISHLLKPEVVIQRILDASYNSFALFFGHLHLLVILSGVLMLIGGIVLLFGWASRWFSLMLLIILIPITITIQMGNGFFYGPLWKNIALIGALLFFIQNNPKITVFTQIKL